LDEGIAVARGFESKDVEFQQLEAERSRQAQKRDVAPATAPERVPAARRTIELALTRARSDLENATVPAHRQMLEQAIADLERRLAQG
jgi:hypothetical protein